MVKILEGFDYYPNFISSEESLKFMDFLIKNISWERREIKIFSKNYLQPRLIAYFGEKNYIYSNSKLKARGIPPEISIIKKKIESFIGFNFNTVLLNYYRDHNDSMGKHSDDEKELGYNPKIASLSLGCSREFIIRNKFDKSKKSILLENGSLLVMSLDSQKIYTHEIPKSKIEKSSRINITFRKVM